jgi:hypothetical protein
MDFTYRAEQQSKFFQRWRPKDQSNVSVVRFAGHTHASASVHDPGRASLA